MNCEIEVKLLVWLQLEVAYCPTGRGSFSLRDFHRAVENLPTDAFIPELNGPEALCGRGMSRHNYSLLAFLLNVYGN